MSCSRTDSIPEAPSLSSAAAATAIARVTSLSILYFDHNESMHSASEKCLSFTSWTNLSVQRIHPLIFQLCYIISTSILYPISFLIVRRQILLVEVRLM